MNKRTLVGIACFVLGVGLLLDKFGIIAFSEILSTFWPIILILIGINQLINRKRLSISSTIIFAIGILLLLKNLGLFPGGIVKYIWPIFLIICGLGILLQGPRKNRIPIEKNNTFNHFALFSGLKSKSMAKEFKRGTATAIFGSIDLDLREVELSGENVVLELTTAFGGIDIRVPSHWRIITKGIPIFGGWANKTNTQFREGELGPIVNVKCLAVFGGIEIRN